MTRKANNLTMLKIDIVEDTPSEKEHLIELIAQFQKENNEFFEIQTFDNGFLFLDNFKPDFNLVFLDIAMPGINGVEVSQKLRKMDPDVCLIFVTNLAQYAIKGYEVEALDFLLKPVKYIRLEKVMQRAIKKIELNSKKDIVIKTTDSFVKISSDDIISVVADDHIIIYHTLKGDYQTWSSLKAVLGELSPIKFYRIGKSSIINLNFVKGIKNGSVMLKDGSGFPIPRGKKGEFVSAMGKFLLE